MKSIIGLVLVVAAAVFGYFSKPTEAAMKNQADAVFAVQRKEQVKNLDIGGLAEGAIVGLTRTAEFKDLVVLTRYTVSEDNTPVLTCWGAFTRVMCPTEPKSAKAG